MIGYILIGIGAWLVYDDHKTAKAKKGKGGQDGIHENGNDRSGGNRAGKPGESDQKLDGDGRVTAIGIPVQKLKKGVKHGVSEKSVHKVKPDQNGNSAGDNRAGQPDATSIGDQGKSLKNKSKSKEGGQDAGNKINHENDAGDNGDNVGAEPNGRDEPNGKETDQGGRGRAGD